MHAAQPGNTQNPICHIPPCCRIAASGSTTNGYDNSARSDPAFDNEYSQYGDRSGNTRLYHRCNSGPVVDRMKYGSPTVAVSSSTIRSTGDSSPDGFQSGVGRMFSSASATTSRIACATPCSRTGSRAETR
jgi:hypothetical protein